MKVLAQPKSPSSDYKYVLRIQQGIESEVGFYLDEPMTGDLKKVHRESTEYLLLSEIGTDEKILHIRSDKIKRAVGELMSKNYNPYIKPLKKKNVRYHYIYIDEFSKD
ncbi:MAG: hypothetical protein VW833_06860 [Candidatus Neomarinimicrobiota bacterium]